MIDDWRNKWRQGILPFVFVQLGPYTTNAYVSYLYFNLVITFQSPSFPLVVARYPNILYCLTIYFLSLLFLLLLFF
jgi:hypothetical protein